MTKPKKDKPPTAQEKTAHSPKPAKLNGDARGQSGRKNERPVSADSPAPKKVMTESDSILSSGRKQEDPNLTPFLKKQHDRLLQLRDGMLDSMMGVAKDNLRARAEGSEASAFGMHQADAGSDAYDRDFALSLLSQEQDALYEIDEAIKRVEAGTYGMCEMSGKPIPHARLEAIPFARLTVECQSQVEKQRKLTRMRQPVTSLFGLTDEEASDGEEEETPADNSKE